MSAEALRVEGLLRADPRGEDPVRVPSVAASAHAAAGGGTGRGLSGRT